MDNELDRIETIAAKIRQIQAVLDSLTKQDIDWLRVYYQQPEEPGEWDKLTRISPDRSVEVLVPEHLRRSFFDYLVAYYEDEVTRLKGDLRATANQIP